MRQPGPQSAYCGHEKTPPSRVDRAGFCGPDSAEILPSSASADEAERQNPKAARANVDGSGMATADPERITRKPVGPESAIGRDEFESVDAVVEPAGDRERLSLASCKPDAVRARLAPLSRMFCEGSSMKTLAVISAVDGSKPVRSNVER